MSIYYLSTEIYSKQSCQIKMVCQNLETIWLVIQFFSLVIDIVCRLWLIIRYFSLVKKIVSVFTPFGAASQSGNVHNFRCFPWIDHGFKVCRHCFSRKSKTLWANSFILFEGWEWVFIYNCFHCLFQFCLLLLKWTNVCSVMHCYEIHNCGLKMSRGG